MQPPEPDGHERRRRISLLARAIARAQADLSTPHAEALAQAARWAREMLHLAEGQPPG